MEHVDAILWHKVGLADFKGIHSINRNGKGSSQTYFQAAGYDKNDLSTMLKYATNKIDTGKKWDTGDPKIKYVIDAIAFPTLADGDFGHLDFFEFEVTRRYISRCSTAVFSLA